MQCAMAILDWARNAMQEQMCLIIDKTQDAKRQGDDGWDQDSSWRQLPGPAAQEAGRPWSCTSAMLNTSCVPAALRIWMVRYRPWSLRLQASCTCWPRLLPSRPARRAHRALPATSGDTADPGLVLPSRTSTLCMLASW